VGARLGFSKVMREMVRRMLELADARHITLEPVRA